MKQAVILAGGIPVRVPLNSDYLPDWERIDSAMSKRTKLLIINNHCYMLGTDDE